jgi:hypothetical protein
MLESLAKICNDYGQLVGVKYALLEGVSHQISAILMQFEAATATFRVISDDDTIEIYLNSKLPNSEEILVDMSTATPWEYLIGSGIFWAWQLTNQQGYVDGIRLEFGKPNSTTIIEFIVVASTIKVFRIAPASVREGWEEAFKEMSAQGDDELFDS